MRNALLLFAVAVLLGACAGRRAPRPPDPPPADRIIIPHKEHAEADVNCIACHEGVYDEEALATVPEAKPSEDTCLQCHKEQKESGNCGFCHTDVKHAAKPVLRAPPVTMSHAKHIERVKEDCTKCHKSLPNPLIDATVAVKMSDCLSCHEHGEQYAVTQCKGCHENLAAYALKPVSDFSHQGNYIEHHAGDARSSAEQCAQCHDQTFCSDCHAKTVATRIEAKFPEKVAAQFIHSNDFLARHSIEQAADSASCQRCHGRSFCDSCHQAQHLTTLALNPRDPHPVGWSLPGSANFHGQEARRDIGSCAACHDQGAQSNCVTCHKVGGIGGNPHPASWLGRHDQKEIANNGMCRICHQ
jgi:hypothetical protein